MKKNHGSKSGKARPNWYEDFFRNSFYNPATPKMVAKAPAEADFVMRQLKLKKGAALLDLCCGPARHSVEFARHGLSVTGLDLSREYLREAAQRAKENNVQLRLVRGDMRRPGFRGEFDAVVNLFTSFGYFLDISDDIRTLKGVARALKPGGLFLIDIIYGPFVRKTFLPKWWTEAADFFRLEQAELTEDGIHNTWTRVPKNGDKTQICTFYGRLYDKPQLTAVLKKAGLTPLKFWGDFKGRRLSARRKMMVCLAKKD